MFKGRNEKELIASLSYSIENSCIFQKMLNRSGSQNNNTEKN